MTAVLFTAGLDRLYDWADNPSDYGALLIVDWTPDPDTMRDFATVDLLLGEATECSDVDYARATAAGTDRVVSTERDRITYFADDGFTFGTVAPGTSPTPIYAVVYKDGATDADRIPIYAQELDELAVATLPDIRVSLKGLARVRQATA